MVKRRLTAIGSYVFAGGFTLGIEKRFEVLGHLEDGSFGVETARHNFPLLKFETDPLRWEAAARSWVGKRSVDLLYCNPPCAAWSKAGTVVEKGMNAYKEAAHYTDCTRKAFALALSLRPKIWVWESVPQAWDYGHEFVRDLARILVNEGYAVTLFFTDLQLHGCPQSRPRFHLIAHRMHLHLHGRELYETLRSLRFTPAKGVIDFLVKNRVKPRIIADIGESRESIVKKMIAANVYGSVRQFSDREVGGEHMYPRRTVATEREYRVGRPPFLVKRVKPDGVCETVTGGANLVHPVEPRYLSVEEQKALGGWPKSFEFIGGVSRQYAEIGKAVQPATASFLADIFADSIKAGRSIRNPYSVLLDIRPCVKGKSPVYGVIEL